MTYITYITEEKYISKLMRCQAPGAPIGNTQSYLLEPMRAMNYKPDDGVCFGFSFLSIQALYSKDFKTFRERVNTLLEIDKAMLDSLEDKENDSSTPYFTSNTKINDIRSFFENIILIQDPKSYPQVFANDMSLVQTHAESRMPVTNSREIEAQGGLSILKSLTGIYDLKRLENYMDALHETALKQNHDMAFVLAGHEHAMSLSYEAATQSWRLTDVNNPESDIVPQKELASQLHKFYRELFTLENGSEICIVFETKPVTVNAQQKNAEKFMETLNENKIFQAAHEINAESANMATTEGTTWAHIAADTDEEIYLKLLEAGADSKRFDNSGMTPYAIREQKSDEALDFINIRKLISFGNQFSKKNGKNFSEKNSLTIRILTDGLKGFSLEEFKYLIGKKYFTTFIRTADDLNILKDISDSEKISFLDKLGNEKLSALIQNVDDLIIILKIIPDRKMKDFLDYLGEEKLLKLISRPQDAVSILRVLPHEEANLFLNKIVTTSLLVNAPMIIVDHQTSQNNIHVKYFPELKFILENKSDQEKSIILSNLLEADAYKQINDLPAKLPSPEIMPIYAKEISEGKFHKTSTPESIAAALTQMNPSQRLTFFEKIDINHDFFNNHLQNAQSLQLFLKSLSSEERKAVFEKIDSNRLYNMMMASTHSSRLEILPLIPDEKKPIVFKAIGIENTKDLKELVHIFKNLPKDNMLDCITEDQEKQFFKTFEDEKLLEMITLSSEAQVFLEMLPYIRQSLFMDKLFIALQEGKINDDIKMLPILEERDQAMKPVRAEENIIAQLKKYVIFAQVQASENKVPSPSSFFSKFFSAPKQTDEKLINKTMKILDRTDNVKDAIMLITDILRIHLDSKVTSDPFATTLVQLLVDDEDKFSASKGLLSLSEDELKNFKTYDLEGSKENVNPNSNKIPKKKIIEAIDKLNGLSHQFGKRLQSSS